MSTTTTKNNNNKEEGEEEEEQGETITPLFDENNNEDDDDNNDEEEDNTNHKTNVSFAEAFRDKVRAILEHFDVDQDDHLKFDELKQLQKVTENVILSEEMYIMACKALDCHPNTGISLDALKLTYASEGANLDKDYYKVFPERKPKSKSSTNNGDEEIIYEIGEDGAVDISS